MESLWRSVQRPVSCIHKKISLNYVLHGSFVCGPVTMYNQIPLQQFPSMSNCFPSFHGSKKNSRFLYLHFSFDLTILTLIHINEWLEKTDRAFL